MADLEWDDDEHYLAEAEHSWGTVAMLSRDGNGMIRCANKGEVYDALPEDLTPTGRRYTLTQPQEN